MTEVWAGASGLPTAHAIAAALHVAAIIDPRGSTVGDAFESYWHHATGGSFPPDDLKRGEALLLSAGLVTEQDGILYPTEDLRTLLDGTAEDATLVLTWRALAAMPSAPSNVSDHDLAALVPDPDRREEFLIALGRTFDDTMRRELGAAGEELVVAEARQQLEGLGYPQLAREVRRVSLLSDQLGYDISAPRIHAPRRLLEVKATSTDEDTIAVALSRNEAETAQRLRDWYLVVCRVESTTPLAGHIVGWARYDSFETLLPVDSAGGRWQQAEIRLRGADLIPGLPRPVH